MATYYWVGGSGTWDSTDTTNWSLTDGGTGGDGVPGIGDRAYISLSGAITFSFGGDVSCDFVSLTATSDVTFAGSGVIRAAVLYTSVESASIYDLALSFEAAAREGYLLCKYFFWGTYPVPYVTMDVGQMFTEVLYAPDEETKVPSSLMPIKHCSLLPSNAYFGASADRLTVGGDTELLLRKNPIVYGFFERGAGSRTTLMDDAEHLILDQDSTKSRYGSLVFDYGTYERDLLTAIHVNKGTVEFKGSANITTLTVSDNSNPLSLLFAIDSRYQIDNFIPDGNTSRNTTIKSTVDGVRALVDARKDSPISYVDVQDIQILLDDEIISYTTDSNDLGNNWQWYFDDFDKPTRSLFFGSHV